MLRVKNVHCHFGTAGLRVHNSKGPGTAVKINSLSYLSTVAPSGYISGRRRLYIFLHMSWDNKIMSCLAEAENRRLLTALRI